MTGVKEIRSVRRAVEVLEVVARQQPAGVSDIARSVELDKSTVQRILVTLEAAAWVQRDASSAWSIAEEVAEMLRSSSTASFAAAMQPRLDQIRDRTGETTMLVVIDGELLSVLAAAESTHPLRIGSPAGSTLPARNSSAIRAMASTVLGDEDRLDDLLRIDPSIDVVELELIRTRGWSVNDGAIVEDVCVIGRAVHDESSTINGAVIVAGPSSRVRGARVDEIGAVLVNELRVPPEPKTRSSGH